MIRQSLSVLLSAAMHSAAWKKVEKAARDRAQRWADDDRLPRLIAGPAGLLAALLANESLPADEVVWERSPTERAEGADGARAETGASEDVHRGAEGAWAVAEAAEVPVAPVANGQGADVSEEPLHRGSAAAGKRRSKGAGGGVKQTGRTRASGQDAVGRTPKGARRQAGEHQQQGAGGGAGVAVGPKRNRTSRAGPKKTQDTRRGQR